MKNCGRFMGSGCYFIGVLGIGELLLIAFSRPSSRHPEDGDDQKGLERQSRPADPGVRGEAVDFHVRDGHVDVGGKNRDEEQGEAPAGQELNRARGDEQADAAEQLENAANFNAGKMKRNPRRHDGKEEFRMAEMDRPGEEEERGEKEADDGAEDAGEKRQVSPYV